MGGCEEGAWLVVTLAGQPQTKTHWKKQRRRGHVWDVMKWEIIIMPPAKKHLKAILDQRVQRSINECIERLAEEPEQQGKPLSGTLAGYRSVRAFRQRYRIVYEVDTEQKKVLIHIVGIRKEGDRMDVYALAKRILRLGLLIFVF